MIAALYLARYSAVHRCDSAIKLAALPVLATALFATSALSVQALALALVLGLYALARLPASTLLSQLRPLAFVLAILFGSALYFSGLLAALVVVVRLCALVLAAGLVTLTTRTSDMMETLEALFAKFAFLGVDAAKASLAVSLALRFLPVLAAVFADVQEAQAARGRGSSLFALAVPLLVRTLKMADEIADAIDARS